MASLYNKVIVLNSKGKKIRSARLFLATLFTRPPEFQMPE